MNQTDQRTKDTEAFKDAFINILDIFNEIWDGQEKAYSAEQNLTHSETKEKTIKRRVKALKYAKKYFTQELNKSEYYIGSELSKFECYISFNNKINEQLQSLKNYIAYRNKYKKAVKAIEESINDLTSTGKYVTAQLAQKADIQEVTDVPEQIELSDNIVIGYLANRIPTELYTKIVKQLSKKS